MLRISYKNRKAQFLINCKKRDVQEALARHMKINNKGKEVGPDKKWIPVEIPPSDVIAEWQDGDRWKDDAPAETIPVPGV